MNVLNSVDLVPPDHRAFVGQKFFLVDILWVQNIFSSVFCGSKLFLVGISCVRNFYSWAFRRFKSFSRGYFVDPKLYMTFNKLQ